MNTLLTFKPALGTDCPSPFGIKAEALLVMSKLPFNKEFGDILKAPRKKLPVLKAGSDLIPDSAHTSAISTRMRLDVNSRLYVVARVMDQ